MNIITKMENTVISFTGCSREIANTVVNLIIDEWEESNREEEKAVN